MPPISFGKSLLLFFFSPHCSTDPSINLNFSIFLYNSGERKEAAKQFNIYETKMEAYRSEKGNEIDQEVCNSSLQFLFNTFTTLHSSIVSSLTFLTYFTFCPILRFFFWCLVLRFCPLLRFFFSYFKFFFCPIVRFSCPLLRFFGLFHCFWPIFMCLSYLKFFVLSRFVLF